MRIAKPRETEQAYDKIIGERLRYHRKILGLSMQDVAPQLEITYQQLQKIENGVNRIGIGRLLMLCEILDVSPSTILDCHKIDTKITTAQANLVKATHGKSEGNISKLTAIAKVMK